MIDRTGQVWEYYSDELFVVIKSTKNGAHQIRHDTLLLVSYETDELPIEGEFFEDFKESSMAASHHITDLSPWEKIVTSRELYDRSYWASVDGWRW